MKFLGELIAFSGGIIGGLAVTVDWKFWLLAVPVIVVGFIVHGRQRGE